MLVLICVSLIVIRAEHIFIRLLTICVSSVEMSVLLFCPLFDWVFVVVVELYALFNLP